MTIRRAVATRPDQETQYVELTAAEIAQRQADEAAYAQDEAQAINLHKSAYRKKREAEGITYMSKVVDTDMGAQIKLTPIYVKASATPSFTINWRTQDGSWLSLNQTEFLAMADAILLHIQKCFQAQEILNGNTYESIEAVEAAFDAAYNSL